MASMLSQLDRTRMLLVQLGQDGGRGRTFMKSRVRMVPAW